MYRFINDYSEAAHPRIIEALLKANEEQNPGYGNDPHCEAAKTYIKSRLGNNHYEIHFIPGGTITNLLAISSFLRPHECVISADTGHINVHETGAIEATGHKVYTKKTRDGKLTPKDIVEALDYHTDEHMVKPKMVYISNTTELGTIYSKEELSELYKLCREKGLLLYLDGARLGSALTCKNNDLTLSDIAELTDVFTIGGTKNGALFGEALVICNESLKDEFRYLMKQRGAMMAKGFVLGIQFEELFRDNLYFELAKHANRMAEKIADTLTACGYKYLAEPCSNQLFPIMPNEILNRLSDEFDYQIQERIDENHTAIRFVTSWATKEEAVDRLCAFFKSRAGR